MKSPINAVLIVILLAINAPLQAAPDEQMSAEIPITTLSGTIVQLRQYQGKKPVYLKFWATWCQPCRQEMPHLQHVYEEFGDNIQVIAINLGINDDEAAIGKTMQEYGLTMPIAIDKSGQLAKAFNLLGTPYHVLLDKQGNVVHRGHEASQELDEKIRNMYADKVSSMPKLSVTDDPGESFHEDDLAKETTGILFLATWCDWYLEESRPVMSRNCINAQHEINEISAKHPQIKWLGLASRLWTGEKELAEYKSKYSVRYPLEIDKSNNTFVRYGVKHFPTLVVLRNGEEILRITKFVGANALSEKIERNVLSLKN